MKEMTDEEADALDEYYTKNPPKVDPSKNGGFAKKSFRIIAVDSLSEAASVEPEKSIKMEPVTA